MHNNKLSAFPRMHNKFIICIDKNLKPYEIITSNMRYGS